ncbi:MAG: Na+/H+ antiporter subunit E [Hadesarchaea archaeon]|nr:Na+/H+ antiporter subunit E [Hadesarchaea archaeon]
MVSAKLPATFLCLLAMWIALTASFDPQELVVGAVASGFVAVISYELLFHKGIAEKLQLGRWAYALAYVPAYIWAELKAHASVIYRILHPRMPIRPGIVRVPTELKTDFGVTGLANAITMTPGTLSVEIDEEKPSLYVHWIDVKAVEPEQTSKQIAWPFERFLRRIFR